MVKSAPAKSNVIFAGRFNAEQPADKEAAQMLVFTPVFDNVPLIVNGSGQTLKPAKSKVAPELTVVPADVAPNASSFPTFKVPELTVMAPVCDVFAPCNKTVPPATVPVVVKLPAPDTKPETVSVNAPVVDMVLGAVMDIAPLWVTLTPFAFNVPPFKTNGSANVMALVIWSVPPELTVVFPATVPSEDALAMATVPALIAKSPVNNVLAGVSVKVPLPVLVISPSPDNVPVVKVIPLAALIVLVVPVVSVTIPFTTAVVALLLVKVPPFKVIGSLVVTPPKSKVAPDATIVFWAAPVAPKLLAFPNNIVPALMLVTPFNDAFATPRFKIPTPFLIKLPPLIAPAVCPAFGAVVVAAVMSKVKLPAVPAVPVPVAVPAVAVRF